jgi:hypothetical protein
MPWLCWRARVLLPLSLQSAVRYCAFSHDPQARALRLTLARSHAGERQTCDVTDGMYQHHRERLGHIFRCMLRRDVLYSIIITVFIPSAPSDLRWRGHVYYCHVCMQSICERFECPGSLLWVGFNRQLFTRTNPRHLQCNPLSMQPLIAGRLELYW